MKRQLLFLLLGLCSTMAFSQIPPSYMIDLGKYGIDDSFSFTDTKDVKYLPNLCFGEAADMWYK